MDGKYKILPADVLVLAGLYAADLMNSFLLLRSFATTVTSGIVTPLILQLVHGQ
jgi:hypothetical protein